MTALPPLARVPLGRGSWLILLLVLIPAVPLTAIAVALLEMPLYLPVVAFGGLACAAMLKRGRIDVYPEHLVVQEPYQREVSVPLSGSAAVALLCYEEGTGRSRQTWWEVRVGERRVIRGSGEHLRMRGLAEALSRATGRPFADGSGTGPSETAVAVEPIDLDLPLRERLQRYPGLMVEDGGETVVSGIEDARLPDGTRRMRWPVMTGGVVGVMAFLLVLALGAYFMAGKRSPSPFTQHGWDGFLSYAKIVALVFAALVAFLSAFAIRVAVDQRDVTRCLTFFTIPLVRSCIPLQEIEDVRCISDESTKIISDRGIISLRTYTLGGADSRNAAWLTHQLQREIASRQ